MTAAHRCDILNLEWNSRGRDIDIVEPVLTALESRYGYLVKRDSIMDYAGMLTRHRPRLFLISNQGGADINFWAVKLASQMGCKVATLVSEGDYPAGADAAQFEKRFWGWNTDRVCYEDLHLEWSARNAEQIHRLLPGAGMCDVRVSGATGFDRFQFMPFSKRQEFLRRHGYVGDEHMVGVAGWTFDHVLGRYFDAQRREATADDLLHRKACGMLRSIWDMVTSEMPDVVFVMKHHPGVTQEEHSEFHGLDSKPNVVILRGMEENVADVISASDIWFAYESTTCMEAWLMGKQTVLVNPAGSEFPRSDIARGSPKIESAAEVAEIVRNCLRGAPAPGWAELEPVREGLIRDKIGWSDGLNHMRAALAIRGLLESPSARTAVDSPFVSEQVRRSRRIRFLRRSGLIHLQRYASIRNYVNRMNRRFDHSARELEALRYREALTQFHARNAAAIAGLEKSTRSGHEGVGLSR